MKISRVIFFLIVFSIFISANAGLTYIKDVIAQTATETPTAVPPTATPVPPTSTPVPPTATSVPPTATAVPTSTNTPTPTNTSTPTPTPTNTPTPTYTPTPTGQYNIQGNVFLDTNLNKQKDTEAGYASGARVTLSGSASRTATTDSQGNYRFSNLYAGSYQVSLTLPSGYMSTTALLQTLTFP